VKISREKKRAERGRLRLRVLRLFGNKCIGCGIEDARVLQVNHKNGQNGVSRKESGIGLYYSIVNGSRKIDDLELRCANCNIIYEYERGQRRVWLDGD
jgi:hypothetical protein